MGHHLQFDSLIIRSNQTVYHQSFNYVLSNQTQS